MQIYPYQIKKLQKFATDYSTDLNGALDKAMEVLEILTDLKTKGAVKFIALVPVDENANVVSEESAVHMAPIPLDFSCVSSFRDVTYDDDGVPIILPFLKPGA